ncbi:MAG: YeeE/YedE family protein [Burkholderiales bacterium]|nr:YeeE/YedE family protein [Burkholderiales bacterium]
MTPVSLAWVLLSGALFGCGLALSTMVRPEVVLSFLRFVDFGLLLVLGGAVAVTLVAYQVLPRVLGKPMTGTQFHPHPSILDARTIGGAAIFGIGWGLCGVCPGPAIAGLGTGNWPLLFALAGIFAGAYVQGRWFGEG